MRFWRSREWCDAEVLRAMKRRSLARLRKEGEDQEENRNATVLHQGLSRGIPHKIPISEE